MCLLNIVQLLDHGIHIYFIASEDKPPNILMVGKSMS